MKLLVLGGTAWLGGHLVTAALAAGHDVTCLARGSSGSVPPGAALVRADRDTATAYDQVADVGWDVVLDVARQPGHVRRATAALAGRSAAYVLVSSISVYADHATAGADEAALLLPALAADVMPGPEAYGRAKVACEGHALRAFGADRTLIARAGLIGGPGDSSDRTGYWPWRFARPGTDDGAVLAPRATEATQVLDVRDLAGWLVEAGPGGVRGIVDAVGTTLPLAAHLEIARRVAGHDGPVVAADADWLLAAGVAPWAGEKSLPLWLGDAGMAGLGDRAGSAARAAGLRTHPVEQTLDDVLAWELQRKQPGVRRAGLTDDDQRALLHRFATR